MCTYFDQLIYTTLYEPSHHVWTNGTVDPDLYLFKISGQFLENGNHPGLKKTICLAQSCLKTWKDKKPVPQSYSWKAILCHWPLHSDTDEREFNLICLRSLCNFPCNFLQQRNYSIFSSTKHFILSFYLKWFPSKYFILKG